MRKQVTKNVLAIRRKVIRRGRAHAIYSTLTECQALLHYMTVRLRCRMQRAFQGCRLPRRMAAGSLINLFCQTASMTNASVFAASAPVKMTTDISSRCSQDSGQSRVLALVLVHRFKFHPVPRTVSNRCSFIVHRSSTCTTSSSKKARKKERSSHRLQLFMLLGTEKIKTV